MSFSYKFRTIRRGNSYDLSTKLEMSANEQEVTGGVEADAKEGNEENFLPGFSRSKNQGES